MATVLDMLENFRAMDLTAITEGALQDVSAQALTANKTQLYDGKTSTGDDVSPTYLEDPYFEDKAEAQRYSDWKDQITPNKRRKKGVPNLFINGKFYSTITVQVQSGGLLYKSSFEAAPSIESTFGNNIYGLGGELRDQFLYEVLRPNWFGRIESDIGLKFK